MIIVNDIKEINKILKLTFTFFFILLSISLLLLFFGKIEGFVSLILSLIFYIEYRYWCTKETILINIKKRR